jgi:SH3 domain-containing YSC84-like protein 1
MRTPITALLLLGLAVQAWAIEKFEVDKRIMVLTAKFEDLQAKADKRIPPEALRKALGIILLDRTKAGFIFAYQGGSGLAMVKEAKSGRWSPPAFFSASEASLGFQIGGQQSFVAILLMNTNATRGLTEPRFDFGGEASGTAGNSTGKAEGTVPSDTRALIEVYSDSLGLYGGAAIKGGAISPDSNANVAYYGQAMTPKEILFDKKPKPTDAATALAQKITQSSK